MAIVIAGFVMVGWMVGAGLLVRALHVRAWRIEAAELDAAEQAYRLHRLIVLGVALTGGDAVLGLAGVVYLAVAIDDSSGGDAVAMAIVGAGTISCVVPMIAAVRLIRRSYARVHGAPIREHSARYVLVLTAVTAALVAAGIALGHAVLPAHGTWHVAGLLVVYLLVLVVVQLFIPPLLIVSLRAAPLPDATRRRLRRLAARMGVRVRDIRVVPGRAQRLANAAQIGTMPGLRYIVVTDYLLDRLDSDQVDAVVAHELGHVRGHHLGVRLCSVFGVWAVLEAACVTVNALTDTNSTALLVVPVLLAFPIGLVAVQGLLGVRLEERADDAAARAVGGARLASALETIRELNEDKPDAGRLWTMLSGHPDLENRLRRLRTRVPATTALR